MSITLGILLTTCLLLGVVACAAVRLLEGGGVVLLWGDGGVFGLAKGFTCCCFSLFICFFDLTISKSSSEDITAIGFTSLAAYPDWAYVLDSFSATFLVVSLVGFFAGGISAGGREESSSM